MSVGPSPRAARCTGLTRDGDDGENVVAVDPHAGHAVRLALDRE